MKIGQKYEGTVSGLKPYGAFVDLDNGIKGLIHISEIKTGYVDSVYNVFKIGERVQVQVIDYDEFSGKASLSMRSLEEEKHHFPQRHRFSNSRLKIGFKPLAENLPEWIDESLTFLREREK